MIHTWDFLTEFVPALKAQLEEDEKQTWGDSWLKADPEGMDKRIAHHIEDYFIRRRSNLQTPIPWLKVAGYALIAWIRENHPELWKK